MADKIEVKTIARLERMTGSRNGNPRFLVIFTDYTTAPTAPDTSWAYGAENRDQIGVPTEVHTNTRGHVTYCKPVG